ncbi:MAG: glycosyltransferase [Elusimicrobia bacterium]|nr:glycosyltransferase [Elusimicrobiota bacterium]
MEKKDLISVIIPVYNVEQYLKHCVDSVINQTYKNLEIILVDDGSTDNSGKICDGYALKDNRIKTIHKQNSGVSSARNEGLKIAKGNYIGFIDSDDYIEEDMYEVLYNLLIENKVEIACCDYFVFNKKEKKYIPCSDNTVNEVLSVNEILNTKRGHSGNLWNKLYSKKIIGNIRFDEKLSFGEDYLFVIESFFEAKKIAFCKDAKYYYYYNANSVTRRQFFKKEYLKYIEFYDKLVKYCSENKLQIGYQKYKIRQINWVITFLSWIAKENPIQNEESLKILLKYARKNLGYYLFGNNAVKQKCFLLLSCINFNLASAIYRLIFRKKTTK